MKDKLILIGASGFVGTRLIEEIGEQYKLKNLDKQPSRFHPGITALGDVRENGFRLMYKKDKSRVSFNLW